MVKLNMAKLKAGQRILLCRRNQPIAEITPLPAVPVRPRPIGLAKGRFTVPHTFFEPLPEELQSAFEASRT